MAKIYVGIIHHFSTYTKYIYDTVNLKANGDILIALFCRCNSFPVGILPELYVAM